MQYIPGWWDQLGGQITGFVDKAQQAFAPNFYAQKKLQELIQQNPNILQDFSNMDESQRALLAQGLGFKGGQNPIAGLQEGDQLSLKKEKQNALKNLTPDQKVQRASVITGTQTQENINRGRIEDQQKDAKFNLDQELGAINKEIGLGRLTDQKRADAILSAAQSKYPSLQGVDFKKVIKDELAGKIDPMLVTALQADPGAAEVYNTQKKYVFMQMEEDARTRLAKIKDPNESAVYIRALSELGSLYNVEMNNLRTELTPLDGDMFITKGSPKDQYREQLREQLATLRQRASQTNQMVMELVGQRFPQIGNKLNEQKAQEQNTIDNIKKKLGGL